MTAPAEQHLIELLWIITAITGTLIGVTISILIPPKDPNRQVSKKQLFRETIAYSIIPLATSLFIYYNFIDHTQYGGQGGIIPFISVFIGLVGKPLTIWLSNLNNMLKVIKAMSSGMKTFKKELGDSIDTTEGKDTNDKPDDDSG